MLAEALLAAVTLQDPPPLPDGDTFVQGLVQRHRHREDAVNEYTYDVLEIQDKLDGAGGIKERRTRTFEVFYVKGRPVRRLVAEDGRPLPPERMAKEDRKAREKAEAIGKGTVVTEQVGLRLSAILARYGFRTTGRELVDGRSAIVLDFAPRPGKRNLDSDNVLRKLAGRLWVDEEEGEVVRARVRNTGGIKIAFGLGASVSSLEIELEFAKVDDAVWLPRKVEALASGRMLLLKGFRTRNSSIYSRYRRFQVDADEEVQPVRDR
jgi:hypothetical protein